MHTLIVLIAIIILIFVSSPLIITPKPSQRVIKPISTPAPTITIIPASPLTSEQQLVLDNVNDYRISKGLKKARTEDSVCKIAQERADEVSISWRQVDPNQPQVHDAFLSRKFPHSGYYTENLSRAFPPQDIVNAWINSPSHQENLVKNTPFICIKNNDVFWVMIGWSPDSK